MKSREENSGLIDLDALMKESGSTPTPRIPEPEPWKQVPAPVAARASASTAPAPASKAAVAPARVAVVAAAPAPPPRADDSLEGIATDRSSKTLTDSRASSPSLAAAESTSGSTGSVLVAPISTAPSSRRRRLGAIAGVAAAAVAALVIVRIAHAPGAQSRPSAANAVAAPSTAAIAPAQAMAPVAAPPASPDPNALDPNTLPAADDNGPVAPSPRAPAAHARVAAAPTAPAAAPTAPAAAVPTATITEADLAAVAGKDPGDLGDAMRSAVGPRTDQKGATDSSASNGARQLRPSPGAVVGAIASVLPAARACLGPDDAVRNGSLVFRSDGSVANVDLRGSKTEDACVRTALAKARVEAFADDTFTTRVTVRP